MKKADQLVFVPLPIVGHIFSILEFAKLLVDRFSITVLIMKLPVLQYSVVNNHIRSLSTSVSGRIQFIHLPQLDPQLISISPSDSKSLSAIYLLCSSIEDQKPLVRNAVKQVMTRSESSTRLAGFVLDMLCTSMVDVADELGVPSYVFFPSSAAFLGLMFRLQALHDHEGVDVTELVDSDAELVVPSFINPVPARVLPPMLGEKNGGGSTTFLRCSRGLGFRGIKGIFINTFMELESHAINSFLDHGTSPPIYHVGPMLNLKHGEHLDHDDDDTHMDIMNWLDDQPSSSVVFLCFGSHGFFSSNQVKEIAQALERSQHHFLWSLRQPPPPPPKGEIAVPSDYSNLEQVLPQGFLDRTAGIGKVIGWAPQLAVLAHPSIGGFVSHCGWNSILESIWYGVPIATWPIYSEQQLNAFQLVKELGLAIEITLDYKKDHGHLVRAVEIENGIRNLMSIDGEVKRRVKEMKENIRSTLLEGGSSHTCMARLIDDMISNIA